MTPGSKLGSSPSPRSSGGRQQGSGGHEQHRVGSSPSPRSSGGRQQGSGGKRNVFSAMHEVAAEWRAHHEMRRVVADSQCMEVRTPRPREGHTYSGVVDSPREYTSSTPIQTRPTPPSPAPPHPPTHPQECTFAPDITKAPVPGLRRARPEEATEEATLTTQPTAHPTSPRSKWSADYEIAFEVASEVAAEIIRLAIAEGRGGEEG